MTETVYEQMRKTAAANGGGRVRPEDLDDLKEAASKIKVPAVALNQKVWSPVVPVPDVKALSGDRRDRRAAKELRRELAQIATTATKVGVAMQAVRSVHTYVVHSVDQGQEDMMDILYSTTRHEGMNELLANVISQSLQSLVAQELALAEHHFTRQMENL